MADDAPQSAEEMAATARRMARDGQGAGANADAFAAMVGQMAGSPATGRRAVRKNTVRGAMGTIGKMFGSQFGIELEAV